MVLSRAPHSRSPVSTQSIGCLYSPHPKRVGQSGESAEIALVRRPRSIPHLPGLLQIRIEEDRGFPGIRVGEWAALEGLSLRVRWRERGDPEWTQKPGVRRLAATRTLSDASVSVTSWSPAKAVAASSNVTMYPGMNLVIYISIFPDACWLLRPARSGYEPSKQGGHIQVVGSRSHGSSNPGGPHLYCRVYFEPLDMKKFVARRPLILRWHLEKGAPVETSRAGLGHRRGMSV